MLSRLGKVKGHQFQQLRGVKVKSYVSRLTRRDLSRAQPFRGRDAKAWLATSCGWRRGWDARQFLNAFGKQFLPAGRAFLRRRVVARLSRVHWTLFVPANMHHSSCLCAVDDDGGAGIRAFGFLGNATILSFIENVGLRRFRLPCGSL